jgi:sec-independent protein translocase protein TatA
VPNFPITDKNLTTDRILAQITSFAGLRPAKYVLLGFAIGPKPISMTLDLPAQVLRKYNCAVAVHKQTRRVLRRGVREMLNNIGPMGFLLIAVVVLVLFGRGKVSSLMGEVGKGITSFKKGIKDGENELDDESAEAAKDVTPEVEKDKV